MSTRQNYKVLLAKEVFEKAKSYLEWLKAGNDAREIFGREIEKTSMSLRPG